MIHAEDRAVLHEIPGRYGDIIDSKAWPRLASVFCADAVFDLTDIGHGTLDGLEVIQNFMASYDAHPLTHLMLNVYCDQSSTGAVLFSRVLAVLPDGSVRTGAYRDDVLLTADG